MLTCTTSGNNVMRTFTLLVVSRELYSPPLVTPWTMYRCIMCLLLSRCTFMLFNYTITFTLISCYLIATLSTTYCWTKPTKHAIGYVAYIRHILSGHAETDAVSCQVMVKYLPAFISRRIIGHFLGWWICQLSKCFCHAKYYGVTHASVCTWTLLWLSNFILDFSCRVAPFAKRDFYSLIYRTMCP